MQFPLNFIVRKFWQKTKDSSWLHLYQAQCLRIKLANIQHESNNLFEAIEMTCSTLAASGILVRFFYSIRLFSKQTEHFLKFFAISTIVGQPTEPPKPEVQPRSGHVVECRDDDVSRDDVTDSSFDNPILFDTSLDSKKRYSEWKYWIVLISFVFQ